MSQITPAPDGADPRMDIAHPGPVERLTPTPEAARRKDQAWRLQTVGSFHTRGTPPLPESLE